MRGWWLAIAIAGCHSTPSESTTPSATTATSSPAAPPARKQRLVVTETQVEILDPIRFLTGSASLDPRSTPILDAIASTLAGNPSIKLVAIHAYGSDALVQFQGRIGAERAQVIVDQLVVRGVARTRLLAQGEAAPPPGVSAMATFEILARDP